MSNITPPQVSNLLRTATPGMTGDGHGLQLRIRESGRAQRAFRYRFGTRYVWLKLGDTADVALGKTPIQEVTAARCDISPGPR